MFNLSSWIGLSFCAVYKLAVDLSPLQQRNSALTVAQQCV